MLKRLNRSDIGQASPPAVDPAAAAVAAEIIADVAAQGEASLRARAFSLGDIESPDARITVSRDDCDEALASLDEESSQALRRAAEGIERFATAQRSSVQPCEVPVPGGVARQHIAAIDAAGCYAPGGRYPLPSSVLMTAVTARVAGCRHVVVASPRPSKATLAAASIAGADTVLCVGGAQAIAAMVQGIPGVCPACQAIAGPGNRYVTAAKQLVSGRVRIDMLAGPSELLVIADESGDPAVIAADLLAQCEHDADARGILVTISDDLAHAVDTELERQLETLPTADTAREALTNGFACVVESIDEAAAISNEIAPEHLEVHVADTDAAVDLLTDYGALFIGHAAAEVFGDYGAGPNHTLPTGGTARSFGGLSVFDFLRIRTSLQINDRGAARRLAQDAARLARIEGLEAHARSAECRL
ncbi:MAG: histidinol dehydrogenase [Planctomycetota bacterium]